MKVIPDAYSPHMAMTTVVAAMTIDRPLPAMVVRIAELTSSPSIRRWRWRVVRNRA